MEKANVEHRTPNSELRTEFGRVAGVPKLPERPKVGHKGLFGRVLVIGGNDGMIGAPVMAGTAALRMGSGLVQVAVPRSILPYALSITPELIGLGLGKASGKDELLNAAEEADAVVVGPGLGRTPEAFARLQRVVRLEKPMVIDADGLNLLAGQKKWPGYFRARAVLTPHPGEMKRLVKLIGREEVPTDEGGRIEIAGELARATRQVVVLKGDRTVVTDGGRAFVNTTGDSSLSKAGTGDVLSGMLGCLLGQGMEGFDAACVAVHLHGMAGEIAGRRLGMRCVLAQDVIGAISEALREFEQR